MQEGTTEDAVLAFYAHQGGARMLDDEHMTPVVRTYAAQEAEPLCTEPAFTHLFEIGCAHGRHLRWARDRGLDYDGLDMVHPLVERGRALLRELEPSPRRSKLHVGSAEDLRALWLAEGLASHAASTILFLPFNCFGILARPERVAEAIATTGSRVFLSMFAASPEATEERRAYYTRSGYHGLTIRTTPRGVLFTSSEGMWSIAYERAALEHMLDDVGYMLSREVALGPIAAGYLFQPREGR